MPDDKFFLKLLLPGDVLLFARDGFFNWVIRHMSNATITHTETYIGNGKTIASRNGKGVATYDLETRGMGMVIRPIGEFNLPAVLAWQQTVEGQPYDWTGLYRSFVENKWGKPNGKMWCSEHTTLAQRTGGIKPFPDAVPADSISPGDFAQSLAYLPMWRKAEK